MILADAPVLLADVDGTIALRLNRGPYDWSRVHEDVPNEPVIAVIQALVAKGWGVVFISGRESVCQKDSEEWLERHVGLKAPLFMRYAGDYRADHVIKEEIYLRSIEPQFNVRLVLDDRRQCVDLWRRLGLTTLQVADGNF